MTDSLKISLLIGIQLQTLKSLDQIINNQKFSHGYLGGNDVLEDNKELFTVINAIMNDDPANTELKDVCEKYLNKLNQ